MIGHAARGRPVASFRLWARLLSGTRGGGAHCWRANNSLRVPGHGGIIAARIDENKLEGQRWWEGGLHRSPSSPPPLPPLRWRPVPGPKLRGLPGGWSTGL